jgi:hypothetical protein
VVTSEAGKRLPLTPQLALLALTVFMAPHLGTVPRGRDHRDSKDQQGNRKYESYEPGYEQQIRRVLHASSSN